MPTGIQDAASFYEKIRFNPAMTAEEAKSHVRVLEGIEHDWLRELDAKGVKGLKRARFLLWNGAMLGFLMALKSVKRVGDAGLTEEKGMREN